MLEERIDGQAGLQSGTWEAEESFEVKDGRKQGWFWAYDAVFDLEVSAEAKLVYLNLCRRAGKNGQSYPSHKIIARDCSLSRRTIIKALGELVQVGVIRVKSRKQEGLRNIYYLADLSEWEGGGCAPHAQGCAPHAQGCAPHAHHKGIHKGNTQKDSLSSRERKRDHIHKEDRQELVKRFYTDLGQPRISRQKLEEGAKILENLEGQGFSLEQITWGMGWIMRNQGKFDGEVYSLRLLPEVIGQALKEAEKVKREEEKKRKKEREEQLLGEEQARRVALEELYRSLPPEGQASLREKAEENLIQQGIQKPLLLEALVRDEICRLLREREQSLDRSQSLR